MSEFINNISERRNELLAFSVGIINGGKRKDYVKRYQNAIDNLTPEDVIFVVHELVNKKYDVNTVKEHVGKILNIFYEPLKNFNKPKVNNDNFIFYLEEENKAANNLLKDIKASLKIINKNDENFSKERLKMKSYFEKFKEFEKHYSKKENILFPYIEKKYEQSDCLKVMWAFHDEIRDSTNKNIELLDNEHVDLKSLNKEIGRFFFAVLPVMFREDYILHPFVIETFNEQDFYEMLIQSFEIGFAYIKTPKEPKPIISTNNKSDYSELGNLFADLGTGILTHEQIEQLINHLPIDITFVDENDTVRFFSNPKHRFFTRSKAIIGRTVQNCHPHESVHIVDEILTSFKAGKKEKATFWIQMKGRFILIEYYAIHDKNGSYKGTIEVSQDVTEIRKLKGEQRLLDWKN